MENKIDQVNFQSKGIESISIEKKFYKNPK